MEGTAETLWHIFLLVMTLAAVAAAAILALVPLAFDSPPPGLVRARPWLIALIGLTLVVYLLEWQILH
ncbi:MAG TPA: hypothetical protein VIG64_06105 [Actinomycetota bacterium]